jgi:hypothetical protein
MRTMHLYSILAALVCSFVVQGSQAREVFSFEPSVFQSKDKLASSWKAIAEKRRDVIQEYLFSLGVSSTGAIHLIGIYRTDAPGELLHFQQLDLQGESTFLVSAGRRRGHVCQGHLSHSARPDLRQLRVNFDAVREVTAVEHC